MKTRAKRVAEVEETRQRKWEVLVDRTLPVEVMVNGQHPDLVLVDKSEVLFVGRADGLVVRSRGGSP